MTVGRIKFLMVLCLSMMFVLDSAVMAQNIKTRKDLDKKSLKIYKEAVSEGRKKRFQKSLELFEKVLKKHPECIDAQLRKAGMLHNLNRFEDSFDAFEAAIAMAPEYDPQMYFSLAMVSRDLDRYDLAAKNFQFFIDRTEDKKRRKKAADYRDRALFAEQAYANPVPFEPVFMEGGINTQFSEYVPKVNLEGDKMIFTRKVAGQEDFYVAVLEGGKAVKVEALDALNTHQNEGVHTTSANGSIIIFTACQRRLTGFGSCDLYYSYLKDGLWVEPTNMGKVINTIGWEGQPSLSSDGKKLFFSSNRRDGFGGNDIWMSTRTDTSGWTLPKVLPKEINTKGNEESPFIHPDGHTLYFRSNHHLGMGDFDIFYSRYIDSTDSWTTAKNIGYPINTKGNEGAFSVSLDGKTAYYTSDMAYLEDKANSNLDIYTFDLYSEARPMPSTFVKAKITDINTGLPLNAKYFLEPLNNDIRTISGTSDEEGSFITSLPTNMDYAFFVEKKGYALYSGNFSLSGIQEVTDPFILEIQLTPLPKTDQEMLVETSQPILLNNIFFETGSSNLKPESFIEIDRLAANLLENSTMNIEIHGHTDNVGSPEDNMVLSQDRAESVKQALIERGVSSSRIASKGFGESKPVDSNDTEEGRKNNRRTEFVIKL